jgi:lipopolysaccharide/colanic/teichoic acid biosynthesis glycosyltransferase
MFVISLWIILDSPGPVMCRLKRYTIGNIEFDILEFRTWPVAQQKQTIEPRADEPQCLTRVGRILHRSGMHKLPQLISVLRGEISIVGTHMFANAVDKLYPSFHPNEVRPGLVSWTHPNGDRSEISDVTMNIDRCLDCDRYYLEKRSFFFDVKLLCHALLSKTAYLQNQ